MTGRLIIAPTPIGNLGDITLRALDALREADAVLAEDTRVTGKLLAALGIEGKRLERLDENVMGKRAGEVVRRVQAGETIAYCSDAGMPGISDPGLRLVAAARAADPPIAVEVLPGASAATTAYVASGTSASSYFFGGFFPRKDKARADLLEQLRPLAAALVFYESPNRVADALAAIAKAYPQREVTVCRELTKLHEEVVRANSAKLVDGFACRPSVKGEIVIVVDPPARDEGKAEADALELRMRKLHEAGETPKGIAKALSAEFGVSRNEAYRLALNFTETLRG